MTIEVVDEFLAHHGVKGMRWGKRTGGARPDVGTRKSRYEHYKENPTARQYALGVGKNQAERTASRKTVGKAAAVAILASAAAKIAVNNVPQLAPYRSGVNSIANLTQKAGYGAAAYALVAQGVDRGIDKAQASKSK